MRLLLQGFIMTLRRLVIGVLAAGLVGGLTACKDKGLKVDDKKKKKQAEKEKKKEDEPEPVEPDPDKPATVGLMTVESDESVQTVADNIEKELEGSDTVSVLNRIDHAESLEETDAELAATTLVMFTNPKLEAPFVGKSITAAMDFPAKVLVWDDGGTTNVTFNAPSYVAKRHGIDKLDLFIGRIENGLINVVEKATGASIQEIPRREEIGIEVGTGIITRESKNEASQTADMLAEYVKETDKLAFVGRFDWANHAKQVGTTVSSAHVVWYTHPEQDAKMLKASRRVGLDLPRPMFVYQNSSGAILVAFNDPRYLEMRYGFDLKKKVVEEIDAGLKKVAAKATKENTE